MNETQATALNAEQNLRRTLVQQLIGSSNNLTELTTKINRLVTFIMKGEVIK